ncbi:MULTISPECIES: hypothetical protein [Elioraea]|jgi:hypothetical protein|uniref:hypothetical protein n=1 Tax=Elioraea TaxID=457933 RepID=UPI0003724C56|nr:MULTISPECIES: hypothetical protein [Elioraea]
MLCLVSGFAGPHLDVPAALRIAESLGADTRVAVTLLGMIREGMDEGFATMRKGTPHD